MHYEHMSIFTAITYPRVDKTDYIYTKRRFICYKSGMSTYSNNQNITDYKTFNVKSLKSTSLRNCEVLEFSPCPFTVTCRMTLIGSALEIRFCP